jgi:NAD(P)-dependent dehydrogenase (short-subunit alcohol dehydrogenase family)
MRLKDKIAIITGAGTDIGEAIAHTFAREGANLVLNGLPGDPVNVGEAIEDGATVNLNTRAEQRDHYNILNRAQITYDNWPQ